MKDVFKFPLAAWDNVCLPAEIGGLGIRKIGSFNQALLRKWLWHFGHDETRLWQHVIALKYGVDRGGWTTKSNRKVHGCNLWRSIRAGWDSFFPHVSFKVGDCTHIRFWHDWCCGNLPLKDLYLDLCATNRDASIFTSLNHQLNGGARSWNACLLQGFHDWE